MRKEMGNQNTSGVVEEEKSRNEAPEKSQVASSSDELDKENQILVQEDEVEEHFQEHAEPDFHDTSPSVERQESHGNGEIKRSHLNLKSESTPTITSLNTLSNEGVVDIASESREDQDMSVQEIVETLASVDSSCHFEGEDLPVDAEVVENRSIRVVLGADDNDIEKHENVIALADDIASTGDAALLEILTHGEGEELGMASAASYIKNEIENEKDPTSPNDAFPMIRSQDLYATENEGQDECLAMVEENQMMSELGDCDNSSYIDITKPTYQAMRVEIDSVAGVGKVDLVEEVEGKDERSQIDSINCLKSISSQEYEDTDEINELVKETGLIETEGLSLKEGLIQMAQNQEGMPPARGRDYESGSTKDKFISEMADVTDLTLSSVERPALDCGTKLAEDAHGVANPTTEPEIPASKCTEPYSTIQSDKSEQLPDRDNADIICIIASDLSKGPETSTLEDNESMGQQSNNVSNPRHQAETRKSPSFDFGLRFDARSQESDQTPLLYQTMRMGRSNSESSRKLLDKELKPGAVRKSKHEDNFSSGLKQENGSKGSPVTQDCTVISPKANSNRKPRSSLLTTCMCCAAAIS